MSLQWTAVATFLYFEICILLIFCIPWISPKRWQKIFQFSIWNKVAPYWNKGFLTMIVALIVLFLDAVREVRKYSSSEVGKESKLYPNMLDHLHMKLFRSQRNLYISGFSLFLWLVLRRVITLINDLASATGTGEMLKNQAGGAIQASRKYMEDNECMRQALEDGKRGKRDNQPESENEKLVKEVARLKEELNKTSDALTKSGIEVDDVKKQTDTLTQEYDRLQREHEQLQKCHGDVEDKKYQ